MVFVCCLVSDVSSLYLFNSEPSSHAIRANSGHNLATTAMTGMSSHNSSAQSTTAATQQTTAQHKTNNLNPMREGATPSPLSLSSISNSESTGISGEQHNS